ncbi:hypothetical protein V6N13_047259 [Hibiscus sabdariffa]
MAEVLNRTAASRQPTWNTRGLVAEMQMNELNSATEQVGNWFLNPNWDNSMDQSDPFESALSSMVSSPAASNVPVSGENVMMRELIGKLGNICNSGDASCYSTPLNSPPRLNLSMVNLPNQSTLAPFSADPGFAERAARLSCFSTGGNFGGLNDPLMDSSKLSGNQSVNGTQSNQNSPMAGNSGSDKKNTGVSRSSSPENAESGVSKEESSVSQQIPSGNDAGTRKRKSIPRGKAKEIPSPAAADDKVASENGESNSKRSKRDGAPAGNGNAKAANDGDEKQSKENSKPPEPPKDYIHVRARRGQATDSHSLAERVRREKISERMKFLQDLVPGCNKVIGKAVMLDEIINYVQSLQRQVEFLSMKLATVNPRMDVNMEALLSKDMFQSRGLLPQGIYSMDSSAQAFPFGYQPQQGLPLNNVIPNITESQFSMKTQGFQLPSINGFTDANPQVGSVWEDDLQSIVQMGFSQNQPQSYQGSIATGQVKIEL